MSRTIIAIHMISIEGCAIGATKWSNTAELSFGVHWARHVDPRWRLKRSPPEKKEIYIPAIYQLSCSSWSGVWKGVEKSV